MRRPYQNGQFNQQIEEVWGSWQAGDRGCSLQPGTSDYPQNLYALHDRALASYAINKE